MGHEVYSCDLLPADDGETKYHYQGDIRDILYDGWDFACFHPPCTHLAVSGARWFKDKLVEQQEALDFVQMLMDAPIDKIAIENPISIISSKIRKPDQIIQPWWFGDMAQKATCLWLKNLPPLQKTNDVYDEMMKLPRKEREKIWYCPPGPDRWKIRSQTFPGFAESYGRTMELTMSITPPLYPPAPTIPDHLLKHLKLNKPDGGPSAYYDFPFHEWTTVNDMVEYLSDKQWGRHSWIFKDIVKAATRWGSKDGTTFAYDAKKIIYYGCRLLMSVTNKTVVREYLQQLLDDKQFQER